MLKSILDSTKKVLSIPPSDNSFDEDLLIHINGVFSTLQQLGVGPDEGFMIEDNSAEWDTYLNDKVILNQVKVYMFLEIKIIFDPPPSSFALDALKSQAEEKKWRLNVLAEDARSLGVGTVILDGGGP